MQRDQEAVQRIISALEWTYPYQKLTTVPAKISVTELKRRAMQDDAAESAVPFIQPMQERPLFMEPDKELSSAHKGTVMHFVMQHLDLCRLSKAADHEIETLSPYSTADAMTSMTAAKYGSDTDQPDGLVHEISRQLASMKDNELLTPAEAESVNPAAVAAFFRSPLGDACCDT